MFREINFHPWHNNPLLDYADQPLVTQDGRPVAIQPRMGDWLITCNGVPVYTGSDANAASYILNGLVTGKEQPQ